MLALLGAKSPGQKAPPAKAPAKRGAKKEDDVVTAKRPRKAAIDPRDITKEITKEPQKEPQKELQKVTKEVHKPQTKRERAAQLVSLLMDDTPEKSIDVEDVQKLLKEQREIFEQKETARELRFEAELKRHQDHFAAELKKQQSALEAEAQKAFGPLVASLQKSQQEWATALDLNEQKWKAEELKQESIMHECAESLRKLRTTAQGLLSKLAAGEHWVQEITKWGTRIQQLEKVHKVQSQEHTAQGALHAKEALDFAAVARQVNVVQEDLKRLTSAQFNLVDTETVEDLRARLFDMEAVLKSKFPNDWPVVPPCCFTTDE